MPNNRFVTVVVSMFASAATLGAQGAAACLGPGAAFGVTSYQCASCGVKQEPGGRTQYVFQAEPIVLEAAASSALRAGDVIVAVNGEPIMTRAGSDLFAYPKAGASTITVRRGNARQQVTAATIGCEAPAPATVPKGKEPVIIMDGVVVSGSLPWLQKTLSDIPRSDIESVEVLKGPLAASTYNTPEGRDVIVVKTKRPPSTRQKPGSPASPDTGPLLVIDGVSIRPASEIDPNVAGNARRYGFAIGCVPSCSKARAADGTDYYRFDAYPPIAALVPGGLAERAGIRVGDLVAKIDGRSILSDDGAIEFFRANRTNSMRVTVLRDRSEKDYLLNAR